MRHVIVTANQLSHALRSTRKNRGMSQYEAGIQVGLLPKTISALENHPGSVSIDSLFKILSALGLEIIVESKKPEMSERGNIHAEGGEW